MKKLLCVFLFGIVSLMVNANDSITVAQVYENLVIPNHFSEEQLNDVTKMTRVWGFAKYHHPAFASKALNADVEYFVLLNKILNERDSSVNEILETWVNTLGNFETKEYKIREEHVLINDMSWIDDTILLGKDLSRKLVVMRSAKRVRNQYVKQTQVNLSFIEPEYKDIPENDVAYKLLAVSKFWNAIDSYSPNRNITDRKWEDVLPIYIAQATDSTIDVEHLYSSLVSELDDSHANSWIVGIAGPNIIPIVAKFVDDRMFVYDTCMLVPNELQVGDEIISINGVNPIEKVETLQRYNSYSNRAVMMRDAGFQTLLTPMEDVKVVYRRQGIDKEMTMQSVEAYKFGDRINKHKSPIGELKFDKIAKGVAYVNMENLKVTDGEEMYKCIKRCKYLIIDLRVYPNDYAVLHQLLPQYFFSEERHACTFLLPMSKRPGYCLKNAMYTGATNNPKDVYKGKIAILVDAGTQSRAEYFAMFLQTLPNAITIGSCTAGADGNVTNISLPYTSWGINFTGAGILYPDGTNAQRKGVKIDYVVESTAESMVKGEDEVLEKAIEILKKHFE